MKSYKQRVEEEERRSFTVENSGGSDPVSEDNKWYIRWWTDLETTAKGIITAIALITIVAVALMFLYPSLRAEPGSSSSTGLFPWLGELLHSVYGY